MAIHFFGQLMLYASSEIDKTSLWKIFELTPLAFVLDSLEMTHITVELQLETSLEEAVVFSKDLLD